MYKHLLAINTTTRECSVALLSTDSHYVATQYSERGHDGIVLALIENVLKQAKLEKSDIDLLAFGRGPGAFTGIRVATAVIQGLAVGLNLKVIPVSDLMNVAYQHFMQKGYERVAVAFDARMAEVYTAVFDFSNESIEALQAERLQKPGAFDLQHFSSSGKVAGAGNGFLEFPELLEQLDIDKVECNTDLFPSALATGELALLLLKLNQIKPVAAIDALPVYLRNDVAHKKVKA